MTVPAGAQVWPCYPSGPVPTALHSLSISQGAETILRPAGTDPGLEVWACTVSCPRARRWGSQGQGSGLSRGGATVHPGLVCLLCFLSATCFALQSGSYWLQVFDSYAAPLNLIIFAFFEVVGVAYVYGMPR